ncbi:MAG: hydrogenase maturation nickel metallochaperone HypA [Tannerellaceae bacterium]|jgi:hydrogenase nickel incorporation protein HypA/HybF|nr:hydrogenase maturation nickel metallochaperone HypA [Tannerellaceae bacterium]
MHELSIALSIIELVREQALRSQALSIEEVEIEIGRLSGVEVETLTFALQSAVKDTMLERARIVRRDIEGEGICGDCGVGFAVSGIFSPCPHCGSYAVRLIKGKELRVKSIIINK